VTDLYRDLRQRWNGRRVPSIGYIGDDPSKYYNKVEGVAKIGAAEVAAGALILENMPAASYVPAGIYVPCVARTLSRQKATSECCCL
jgi:hypothetical protein